MNTEERSKALFQKAKERYDERKAKKSVNYMVMRSGFLARRKGKTVKV